MNKRKQKVFDEECVPDQPGLECAYHWLACITLAPLLCYLKSEAIIFGPLGKIIECNAAEHVHSFSCLWLWKHGHTHTLLFSAQHQDNEKNHLSFWRYSCFSWLVLVWISKFYLLPNSNKL